MTAHMSNAQIEKFRARKLDAPEMVIVAAHLSDCDECRRLFQQIATQQMEPIPTSINLTPQFWFKDDHLEYEELIDLMENRLDVKEREIVNLHLSICDTCREDLRSFHEFVNQVERELQAGDRVEEQTRSSWWKWPAFDWKWGYAALAAAGIIVFSMIVWRRSEISRPPKIGPSPAPSTIASSSPQPTATQSVPPLPSPSAIVNRIPEDESLIAADLKKPAVLDELYVVSSAQRGIGDDLSPFKLPSPTRAVIEEDRPTFRWERLEGATAYQVQLVASGSREFTSSERLSAETTQWAPSTPLKRGVVYKWMVTATVNGEEVSSPAVTASEMRFMALSEEQMRELQSLRKRTKSHLVLGAFYARAGMLAEAEREFQTYRNDNPQSPLADKLIRQVQSWR
jgi:predicted anti-sigma-YlaC factor YlaD